MLKNMTVGKKIVLGFASVLVLLTAVSAMAYHGIHGMGGDAEEAMEKYALRQDLYRAQNAHTDWAAHVTDLFMDDSITQLHVEIDDHKCHFGKWLYSDERKKAEKAMPKLAPMQCDRCHRNG